MLRSRFSLFYGALPHACGALGLFFACAVCSNVHAAPPGWNPTFSDEFDGSVVDDSKWDRILWTTPFNNERQAYHPSRATVADGHLVLTADDADFGGKSYTSGKVESKFVQQYGRWEIRAKLPGTQGAWPAIWLLPDTGQYPWPSQGEIDILENRGNQPNLTSSAYHWGANFQQHQYVFAEQQTSQFGQLDNYHEGFHTYAVEWSEDYLRFFVDDVNYYTVYDFQVGGTLSSNTAPAELVLNVAVGGDFLGGAQPNGSSVWPQSMEIDYVRVFERGDDPPAVVLQNGDFEEQGGSLAQWSTFGTRIPSVQTHDEAVFEGVAALKLFGQFNGPNNAAGVTQGITVAGGDAITASASALVRSADSIAGTDNIVIMNFDYFSEFHGAFGSPSHISSKNIIIADGTTANDVWAEHQLTDTVPQGAVEARLAFVFIQPDNQGGAVHIDNVTFENLDLSAPADADGDGDVDSVDLLNWQRGFPLDDNPTPSDGDFNFSGVVDGVDLSLWQRQLGTLSDLVAAVPEPSSGLCAALVAWVGAWLRVSRTR